MSHSLISPIPSSSVALYFLSTVQLTHLPFLNLSYVLRCLCGRTPAWVHCQQSREQKVPPRCSLTLLSVLFLHNIRFICRIVGLSLQADPPLLAQTPFRLLFSCRKTLSNKVTPGKGIKSMYFYSHRFLATKSAYGDERPTPT